MQIFKEKNTQQNTLLLLHIEPNFIEFIENEPSLLQDNDKSFEAACLKCNQPSCVYFSKSEITSTKIKSFPHNQDNRVCAVDAIKFDSGNNLKINKNKCINCGLCAARCPIGAIYCKEGVFTVNHLSSETEQDNYIIKEVSDATIKAQQLQICSLKQVLTKGVLVKESDDIMSLIYSSISKLNHSTSSLFIRNILIGLGFNCASRRIGDVYTRMDLIYSYADQYSGAIEIEFNDDTLSASRRILDDIAVLHSRYSIDKNDNFSLVVCKDLPNNRQGYWQVIKDINNVEKLKINTLTIGALLILLWNFKELNLKNTCYYIDYDNKSIREVINKQIGRTVNLSKKIHSILEPIK